MTTPLHRLLRSRWLTLVVLSLGVALIVIDGTIVNVALPVIIRDLQLDFTDAQWITTIYALVFAGLLITTGRLGDRFGRRSMFLLGVVVFVAGSVWAGFAQGSAGLICARVVQGVGGAMILPSTLSTVNATFRGRDRAIAFGVWGSVIAGMAAVGPLLGGWLTTDVSWRWIFFVNVPVGALLLVGIIAFVPETRGGGFAAGADVVGFLLSAIGLGALVFGLVEGGTYGWWAPVRDLEMGALTWTTAAPISAAAAGIVLGMVLLVLFVAWENRRFRIERSALLDLTLFRLRSFRWGNIAALVVALGEFGMLFALPLYLQNVLDLSALAAGMVLAAMALGAFVAGGLAGHLAQRFSSAAVAAGGLAIEAAGLLVLGLVVHAATPGWLVALILVGYGAGLGLASAQLTSVVLAEVPTASSGQGSATQSTMRQLGSALGAAVLGSVLGAAVTTFASGSLAGIPGLPPDLAGRLEGELAPSAGGIVTQIRLGVIHLADPDGVASALGGAFAHGTRLTLLAGAVVLALGVLATLRLRSVRAATTAAESVAAAA